MLDHNCWDSTSVDHLLMNQLQDTKIEEQLQRTGYLGFVDAQVTLRDLRTDEI